jgi:hypothetical protein
MAIELQKCNLTTPEIASDGDAVTRWYPFTGCPAQYFYIRTDGKVAIFAPTNGASTANSSRTRTEFREVIPSTQTLMNWGYKEFDQFLRGAFVLTQVTPNGKVCVGQIHVKNNDHPPLKIVWDNGTLKVKFRKTYDMADDVSYTLLTGAKLGDRITYSVHTTEDGIVSVNAALNGVLGTSHILEWDTSWEGKLLYFKIGLYNQEDPNPAYVNGEGSAAIFDKIEISR